MEFSETGDFTKHCEISQPIIKIVNLMKLITHATRWTKKKLIESCQFVFWWPIHPNVEKNLTEIIANLCFAVLTLHTQRTEGWTDNTTKVQEKVTFYCWYILIVVTLLTLYQTMVQRTGTETDKKLDCKNFWAPLFFSFAKQLDATFF